MNAAEIEFRGRVQWALARIREVANSGREEGWLAGSVLQGIDSDTALEAQPPIEEVTPMRHVATALGLRAVEVDILWMLACIELAPEVAHAATMLSGGMSDVSVQLLERLVTQCGLLAGDVLQRLHDLALIETTFDKHVPLHRRPVRSHDRVLDLVRGELGMDRTLRSIATLVFELDIRRSGTGPGSASELRAVLASSRRCIAVVIGRQGSGRATMAQRAACEASKAVISIAARELSCDVLERASQLRHVARECRVHNAAPVFLDVDAVPGLLDALAREVVPRIRGPVIATAHDAVSCSGDVALLTLRTRSLGIEERQHVWTRAVGATPEVAQHAAHSYNITPGMIQRVAEAALLLARGATVTAAHVQDGVRAQLDRAFGDVARRIEPTQTWDDLVLPVDQFDLLIELVARIRHRNQVLHDWGFGAKVGRGTGTATLFSGPPGTGKTMIAGLVAKELGLDLYQVDLSKIVSKYIGETEKQLSQVFDAAESGHAVLLFDEADSLFAKRTEVKSSNDRYANLEVNYLLQRMESFGGITILTTNHETAIDQAFMRRLAFHIRVPMPEEREREQLWRAMLPAKAPVAANLDVSDLARRFEMSGGYIRNATLRAAFMAAEEGGAITGQHLEHAARLEYEGMGKIAA